MFQDTTSENPLWNFNFKNKEWDAKAKSHEPKIVSVLTKEQFENAKFEL